MSILRRVWNPAEYQGGRVSRRYFEGWYFKQVDAHEREAVAIIPGISYSRDGSSAHAFVQVVSPRSGAHYFAYPVGSFRADPSAPFAISIGDNTFGCDGMRLALEDGEHRTRGELSFGPMAPWPVRPLSPGIMGWYRFVPGMETYHGVLSMDHTVSGWLEIDGRRIEFDGGRGYAEKDWGRSFPSSWIWGQTNHFGQAGTSLTVSVARVPWMTGAFVGTIAGFLVDGQLHRFATYTGARLTCIETSGNEAHVTLADKHEELELHLRGCEELVLKAPVLGAMDGHDAESLGGTIEVTLRSRAGGRPRVLFSGTGTQAGIEIMNAANELGERPCPERTDADG